MAHWKKIGFAVIVLALGAMVLCAGVLGPCYSAWWRYGVLTGSCPAGVLPTVSVEASGVGRGVRGTVRVHAAGQLYDEQLRGTWAEPIRRFSVALTLVGPDGKEIAVEPTKGFREDYTGTRSATIELPKQLPDGDYLLRTKVKVPSGELSTDVPIALYKPALEHVLTDSPLYRGGQTVKARAVILEAGSLSPAANRPGVWKVWDPSGELVFEEKGTASAMGMSSTTFPLASDAPAGEWAIGFESGAALDRQPFEVREFRLPRLTAKLESEKPWYTMGDVVKFTGTALYTSGAPVQRAPVRIDVLPSGAWPPPNDWLATRYATTDEAGGFTVELGAVPADLVGRAELRVVASVTEAAGETVSGAGSAVLNADPIEIEAVTELAGGLVPDQNNRLFLRVTRPDGTAVANTDVVVSKEWDPRDPGLKAKTDANGVARLQIDPESPITVVEPSLPIRPQAESEPIHVGTVTDRLSGASTLEMAAYGEALERAWKPCVSRVVGQESGEVILRASASGAQSAWARGFTPAASRCIEQAAAGVRLINETRVLTAPLTLNDPGTARFDASFVEIEGVPGSAPDELRAALMEARACAAETTGRLPTAWTWEIAAGSRAITVAPVAADGDPALTGAAACLGGKLRGLSVDRADDDAAAGVLVVDNYPSAENVEARTSPASWPGFAFVVKAEGEGKATLRMPVGEVPPLRLRLSEVLVKPGASVELAMLRGPSYTAELPEKLELRQGDRVLTRFDFDPKERKGTIAVPADAKGFASVEYGGARAVMFIRPEAELKVALSAPEPWKPGQQGRLEVRTTDANGPVPAGVSLVGVDSALAQLAPLPGPDSWADATVLATSDSPAFGLYDARALQTGQIEGENALQATILRVSGLPAVSQSADSASGSANTVADVESPLAEAYYPLYAEVQKAVRAWERQAPEGEMMSGRRMVGIWEDTLRKHPAKDPFGRTLHLSALPEDLRDLADPRIMVADARRLPEDIENWAQVVAKESP